MSNVIITTTLQIQKEDLHIFRALCKMKMESCHLLLYCQLVLYCVIAHVISVFSAFLLTIGFQGTSSYLATFKIKTCSSICLKAPIFFMLCILEWKTTVYTFSMRKRTAYHRNQDLFKNLLGNSTPFISVLSYFVCSDSS